ncbi:MAG: hypothetical protein AB7K24_24620, partial [Gemmataceae bacterium]
PLAEQLLHGTFDGKDTITVKVTEVDGEKKLTFEASTTQPELVASGPAPEQPAGGGEGQN